MFPWMFVMKNVLRHGFGMAAYVISIWQQTKFQYIIKDKCEKIFYEKRRFLLPLQLPVVIYNKNDLAQ